MEAWSSPDALAKCKKDKTDTTQKWRKQKYTIVFSPFLTCYCYEIALLNRGGGVVVKQP